MKQFFAGLMAALMLAALAGCGGGQSGDSDGNAADAYTSAQQVLEIVLESYGDTEVFPVIGGDGAHMTDGTPGAFDVSRTDELDAVLGLPVDAAGQIDDAASMIHMMNANSFTGAAYHLADGADAQTLADAVADNLQARQWICGMPDTLLVLSVDGGYVVTAFGVDELIQTFKTQAQGALSGVQIVLEQAIAG